MLDLVGRQKAEIGCKVLLLMSSALATVTLLWSDHQRLGAENHSKGQIGRDFSRRFEQKGVKKHKQGWNDEHILDGLKLRVHDILQMFDTRQKRQPASVLPPIQA